MKKLFISTQRDELEIDNAENLAISFGESVIYFGDKACVNINEFVSYQFVEVKGKPEKETEEKCIGKMTESERESLNQQTLMIKIYLDAMENVKDNLYIKSKYEEANDNYIKFINKIKDKYTNPEQEVTTISGKTGDILISY
jgi:uncharacterized protein involved in tolerance to divalent cations